MSFISSKSSVSLVDSKAMQMDQHMTCSLQAFKPYAVFDAGQLVYRVFPWQQLVTVRDDLLSLPVQLNSDLCIINPLHSDSYLLKMTPIMSLNCFYFIVI